MLIQDWIGRQAEAEDIVSSRLVASFRATLSPHLAALEDGAAPLALHWCLAPDISDMKDLGADGHPAKGGFLPPISLPRRMWAGSDIQYHGTLYHGDIVQRRSTIARIDEKHGRSGQLVFVTVHHEITRSGDLLIDEDQILAYSEAPTQPAPVPETTPNSQPPTQALINPNARFEDRPSSENRVERKAVIDSVLLFRYSALTFNSHRIHYDFPYATEVEHYPGLVIHGPLQASLLLNLAADVNGRPPSRFSFRATAPATGSQTLALRATHVNSDSSALEILASTGVITMKATAEW